MIFRVFMLAGVLSGVLGACSAYAPDLPAEPFLCGSGTPACPDGYACMTEQGQRVCVDGSVGSGTGLDASIADGTSPADAAQADAFTCAHSLCTTGMTLDASCDACVAQICAQDSYCCETKWSAQCVDEVSSICGESTCSG